MVTAHRTHDGVGGDAVGLPRPDQRVALTLELGIGDGAALVDDRHRVVAVLGVCMDRPGKGSVLVHGCNGFESAIEARERDESGSEHDPRRADGVSDLGDQSGHT